MKIYGAKRFLKLKSGGRKSSSHAFSAVAVSYDAHIPAETTDITAET